jgi:transposase-like protein
VRRNVEAGSTIHTDAWDSYDGLAKDYKHQSFSQRQAKLAGQPATAVPGIDRVVSNLKTWLRGTHHGVGADHLDYYLNEFVFRFNRRFHPVAGFATLLGLSADLPPTTAAQIQSPKPGTGPRRRGRATGLTTGRFSVQVGESKTLEEAISRIEQALAGDPSAQPGSG